MKWLFGVLIVMASAADSFAQRFPDRDPVRRQELFCEYLHKVASTCQAISRGQFPCPTERAKAEAISIYTREFDAVYAQEQGAKIVSSTDTACRFGCTVMQRQRRPLPSAKQLCRELEPRKRRTAPPRAG